MGELREDCRAEERGDDDSAESVTLEAAPAARAARVSRSKNTARGGEVHEFTKFRDVKVQ